MLPEGLGSAKIMAACRLRENIDRITNAGENSRALTTNSKDLHLIARF